MARTAEEELNDDNNNSRITHESEDNSNSDSINNNKSNSDDMDVDKTSSTITSNTSLNQSSDANHSKSSTTGLKIDIKVFFVEVKTIGTVGRQPKSMQNAFASMKSYKYNANWIKEEEVLAKEWSNPDNLLFILDSFDGKVFDFLSEQKLRIISPLTVLYCYSKECSAPWKTIPVKPFPVFSQCMRRLFISISGFDGQKKQDMITKITRMCGNFSKDLTKNVTHLVTESVRSKKYSVAKQRGIAVVSPLWVDECWTDVQHCLNSAGRKEVIIKYQLKPFNKLLITVSQVEVEERKQIERIVVDNGGEYSPSLRLNDPNSILLLRSPDGDKFKYAHMRSIPCLDIQWLYDSRDNGYAMPEENYIIHPLTSGSQESQKLSQNRPKSSNDNQINAISSSDTKRTEDKTIANKTTENINPGSDKSSQDIVENISKLIAQKSDEPFLEGCDVFVVGFSRPVYEIIKSALISSGSVVYNEFKNLVTHVIVGSKCVDTDLIQFFDNKSSKVVSIEWLFDCFRRNECSDCSAFELKRPKSVPNSTSNGSQRKKKSNNIFEGPLTVVCPKSAVKALQKWKECSKIDSKSNHKSLGERLNDRNDIQWGNEDDDDMPSQRPYEKITQQNNVVNETNASPVTESENKESEDKTQEIQVVDIADEKSEDINDTTPKRVFLFSGYDENIKTTLIKIVDELNGTIIESNNVLDCVTHLVIRDPSATEKTLSAIACGLWVLKEDYLYESKKKGEFIAEEEYEWGYSLSALAEAKSVRKRLMTSAVNWRKHLQQLSEEKGQRVKAFDGWDVLFLQQTKMTIPYSQVFRSANANVIQLTADFDLNRLNKIKYAFVDHKTPGKLSKHEVDVGRTLTKMEKLHKIDFISNFIVNGPDSDLTANSRRSIITDKFWDSTDDSQQTRKRCRDESTEDPTPSSSKHRK